MKLRLVLFSSCTLLFSSLSSLSLNAQQEREARLRGTTSLPTLAANGAKPEFGPNVLIFDPAMPSQAIQKQIDAVYSTQEHNEFGQQRNALLFLPGNYSVDVPVGFYTEVMGVGASPDATRIAGNVHADANHEHNNATTTFWRAVGGLSIKPAGGTMQWAVSQAVSLDRKSTRLNSSHGYISYAVICLKQKQRKYSLVYHKLSFTLVFHPRDRVGATSGRVVMLTASQRL